MFFKQLSSLLILAIFSFTIVSAFNLNRDEDYTEKLPFFRGNRPHISIFSKPPGPEAPKTTGLDIVGHASNVIQGGTIGVELDTNPSSGIQGILDSAKKIIPGGPTHPQVGRPEEQKPPSRPYEPTHPQVGRPEEQKPPSGPYEPPKGDDHWEEDKDEHWEEDKDEHWEDNKDEDKPETLIPDAPSWDDIGEDPEDVPSIPYEKIIDPRVKPQTRPKRAYSNSRIYRIPLKFNSNAKPFGVKFYKSLKEQQTEKHINGLFRK